MQEMTDADIEEIALTDIKNSLGITKKPEVCKITRWHEKMSHYKLDYNEYVQAFEREVASRYPNVFLAGSSYHGASIPDCIYSAEHTAELILNKLEKKKENK